MLNLDQLTYDELVALNREIVERLKILDSVSAFAEMAALRIGTKVRFDSNQGPQIATVVKFNTKTVGVIAESGHRWNVSPHLLTEVKEVAPESRPASLDTRGNDKRKSKNKNRKRRG